MASPGTDPRLKSGLLPTRGAPGPQSRPGAGVPGRLARRLPGMEPPLRSCLTDDHNGAPGSAISSPRIRGRFPSGRVARATERIGADSGRFVASFAFVLCYL